MPDEAFFWSSRARPGRRLFVHAHRPRGAPLRALLVLSPLFDENKRVQAFHVDLGRELAQLGWLVVRPDYYGTGDSPGELLEFEATLRDLDEFLSALREQHSTLAETHVLGVRMGADLALALAGAAPSLETLWLVEPLGDGRRYLKEQRLRRVLHFKIHGMPVERPGIRVEGIDCEDHQGFPLTPTAVAFLESWRPPTDLSGRTITVFKLSPEGTRRAVTSVTDELGRHNRVRRIDVDFPDFWARLETVDPRPLTAALLDKLAPSARMRVEDGE